MFQRHHRKRDFFVASYVLRGRYKAPPQYLGDEKKMRSFLILTWLTKGNYPKGINFPYQ